MLNLSRKTLTEFEVNIGSLRQLKLLNLSNSHISTLREDFRIQLDTLEATLDISETPLSCFCDNIDFVHWMKTIRVKFEHKHVTKCLHPTLQFLSPWKSDVGALYRE